MERRGIQLLCNGSIAGVDAALGARVATALESGDGGNGNGDGVVHVKDDDFNLAVKCECSCFFFIRGCFDLAFASFACNTDPTPRNQAAP